MKTFLALAFLSATAAAQTCGSSFAEPFTASNVGAWAWGGPSDVIVTSGGFAGAYRRSAGLDTFAPQLITNGSSVFTGDYRAAQVSSLGVDLQTFSLDFSSTCQRPLALVLENDNGTPSNFADDVFVYALTDQGPCVDGLWHSYSVDVPSQSAALPAGWSVDLNWSGSPDVAWNKVMTNVTRVRWFFGDPTYFFIFATWTVGADNPRIAFAGGPSAYCASQKNSLGCQPRIGWSGTASASSSSPFTLACVDVLNQRSGLLFYGVARQAQPFQGGTLCVAAPIRRTLLQNSGGSASGNDCSGAFALDFNAVIQSGFDPALVAGAQIFAQHWSRDAAAPSTTNLSNALAFRICP